MHRKINVFLVQRLKPAKTSHSSKPCFIVSDSLLCQNYFRNISEHMVLPSMLKMFSSYSKLHARLQIAASAHLLSLSWPKLNYTYITEKLNAFKKQGLRVTLVWWYWFYGHKHWDPDSIFNCLSWLKRKNIRTFRKCEEEVM